jgi:3-hydroxy-5-methyl-1-naphthoate 3-O-methyltransferase
MQTMDLTRSPSVDPVSMYRYRDGLYAADLLTTALVWCDFFSWLEHGPASKKTICAQFGFAERPVDVMLTLLTAMGLLQRDGENFQNTALAREQMVKDSPWFLGPYYASLKDRPVCKDFLQVLKTGKPANWGSYRNEQDWAKAMENPVFAQQFSAAMDCRGVYLAGQLARKLDLVGRHRVLDIGGGSGIYACSLVAHFPRLSATVFEKPPVDKVAREAIAKRGFADRVEVRAGDFFSDPLPRIADVHLISNVLHDWDFPTVKTILEKSAEALPAGGVLVIHDAWINADKTGPLPVAAYSAMLMHATEGKCYSTAEMEELLAEAGFCDMKFSLTAADRGMMTALKE